MATITSPLSSRSENRLRPFDPRRDLLAVADLIETCFAETLDPDGRRYIRQMRSAVQGGRFNRWVSAPVASSSLSLSGFVWVADGKVVGNLSLVPFFHQARRIYLIANVAVDPAYRRRGIAKKLTEAAIQRCRQRRVNQIWLQVRANNPAARALYQKMGFIARASRTTWHAQPESICGQMPAGARVTFRQGRFWPQQRRWLDQTYPIGLRWHFPIRQMAMQPGLMGFFHRFMNDIDIRHWAVQQGGELQGVLSWQASMGFADRLWLAADPQTEDLTLEAVLPYIRRERRLHRLVALDYPAGRAVATLENAGFRQHHTLIWMDLPPASL